MALLTLPRQYIADIDGVPRVGAFLYLYDAGTNNTRVAYTGADFSVPLLQPIQSVEGGIFPAVYINPDGGNYKIVIQDQNGALFYSEDNLVPSIDSITSSLIGLTLDSLKRTPAETAAGVIPSNFAFAPGNIRRYGAVVDGVTDDSTAIRRALNAVPRSGGRIFCEPPGPVGVGSVIYIPQRVAASNGIGLELNFTGCTFIAVSGATQCFESGTGTTSSATNFGQPSETATAFHLGTKIRGASFQGFNVAIKLFNFLQGCVLSQLTCFNGKTFVEVHRCFYLAWDHVNANINGLAATDPIIDFHDEINTMTFNNVHVGGGVSGTGVGYRFNSAVKGMMLTGIGAENLTVGYKFLGIIYGVTLAGNYIEGNDIAIQLGTSADAFNVEANYFNDNAKAIVGNNWLSGRWGHNRYDTAGTDDNDVDLSGTGNLCEVWVPPRPFARQGGSNPHNTWTSLPSNWTVAAGSRLRRTDYIYNDATGFNAPIAVLAPHSSGSGLVARAYTGTVNTTHSGQVPFCTTSVSTTTVTVDTLIPYDANACGIVFDMVIQDNVSTFYICGRTYAGTTVFRYDTSSSRTVTVSNQGGFFRFVFAGFSVAASLIGGAIRIE